MSAPDFDLDPETIADKCRAAERRECLIEAAAADEERAFLPATVLDLSVGESSCSSTRPPPTGGARLLARSSRQ